MASPSRPSVRFTPFDAPVIMISAQMTNSTGPSTNGVSRRTDNASEAGVYPCSSGKRRARTAKTTATSAWAAIFGSAAQAQAPLLGDLDEVVANPTAPSPTMRNRTSSPDTDGGDGRTRWAIA